LLAPAAPVELIACCSSRENVSAAVHGTTGANSTSQRLFLDIQAIMQQDGLTLRPLNTTDAELLHHVSTRARGHHLLVGRQHSSVTGKW